MERVRLNPDTEEVGNTFKIIAVSVIVMLNTLVLTWYFCFSGLIQQNG